MKRHARKRMQQRSVSASHVELTLDYGRPIRQASGRMAYHVGRREAAVARAAGVTMPRLEKVIVVVAPDGELVTVIRSANRRRLTGFGGAAKRRRW